MKYESRLDDACADALSLKAELDRIPPVCDCDADARRAGKCCCHVPDPVFDPEVARALCGGCVAHLERLRTTLDWLRHDLSTRLARAPFGGRTSEETQRIFHFVYAIERLAGTLGRIEGRLESYRNTCAHDDLVRLKESAADLERRAAEFNQAIP